MGVWRQWIPQPSLTNVHLRAWEELNLAGADRDLFCCGGISLLVMWWTAPAPGDESP